MANKKNKFIAARKAKAKKVTGKKSTLGKSLKKASQKAAKLLKITTKKTVRKVSAKTDKEVEIPKNTSSSDSTAVNASECSACVEVETTAKSTEDRQDSEPLNPAQQLDKDAGIDIDGEDEQYF